MKKQVYCLMLICLLGLMSACKQQPQYHDMKGNVIQFSDYRGKWVFVNYWATWCKPCHEEIPTLNAFYVAHQDQDAVVIGVNYDQVSLAEQKKLVKKMAIMFPVLDADPAQELKIKSIPALPVTVVLNPTGHYSKTLYGQQNRKTLEAVMNNHG